MTASYWLDMLSVLAIIGWIAWVSSNVRRWDRWFKHVYACALVEVTVRYPLIWNPGSKPILLERQTICAYPPSVGQRIRLQDPKRLSSMDVLAAAVTYRTERHDYIVEAPGEDEIARTTYGSARERAKAVRAHLSVAKRDGWRIIGGMPEWVG